MRAGWVGLVIVLALVLPSAAAAPASATLRLQAPVDLRGEVVLDAAEGVVALPAQGSVTGTAARLNVTLLRSTEGRGEEPSSARESPGLDQLLGTLKGGLTAPPPSVEYFEMLGPERLTFTTRQSDARALLAVGPFDHGSLALEAAHASVRESPLRVAGPFPPAFVRDADAPALAAGAAGTATARGSVRGLVEGATLLLQNATASLQLDTTYRHDGQRWTALLRWEDADLSAASEEPFVLHAPVLGLRLDGAASSAGAWGGVTVDQQAQRAQGQPVLAEGALAGTLRPGGGSVALNGQGDLAYLTLGDQRQDFARVALGAGAIALGALLHRFLAVPLYARIAPNELLDNEVRRRVHGHVAAHPGADVKDTAAAVGVSWSTAAYHLARLEREAVLTSRRAGRSKRFFLNGGNVTARAEAIGALRNPTALAIAELVAKHPGLMQKELGAALNLPASTVSWHMRRLRELGVVVEDRRWRRAEYAPGPAWQDLRAALAEEPPAPTVPTTGGPGPGSPAPAA